MGDHHDIFTFLNIGNGKIAGFICTGKFDEDRIFGPQQGNNSILKIFFVDTVSATDAFQ